MSRTSTRLLLLGVTMMFEPVNGYQIRRELISWRVDQWAHINPGSIYTGLDTLARQGNLTRHTLREGHRTVAVYTTTAQGRDEFDRLFAEAMRTLHFTSTLDVNTALALQPLVSRHTFLTLLRDRLETLDAYAAEGERLRADQDGSMPPHLPMITQLWTDLGRAERDWVAEAIDRVTAGEFAFAGEATLWEPPEDDPGWQVIIERDRYRQLLGLT